MALVTTEKMLKDAQAGHYAVGAFNVENLEFVMAVLAAAEETKSPVIMQTTPGTIKTAGLDYFYGMVKAAAERASVPVALHLDHGDGYDRCMQAFRTGNFYWRFFVQQFKRSCLPDGPKVGSVTLSPRGDWRMPSDACAALWLAELEQLQIKD